jgi:DDE superfamily endonuclease
METDPHRPHDAASDTTALRHFRSGFYRCLTRWADATFELCDAALGAPAPVASVPALSLEPIFRRSHGSLYKALARGGVDTEAMLDLLAEHRPRDWPLVFAVDASTWARCDAETSPERGFYYSASKHSAGKPIVAGWSYSWITQLDWANNSWTAPMDARRIPPKADATDLTASQVRDLVTRLGQSATTPVFCFDAGYDAIALTHELADVAANIVVRIRDDRVFYTDPTPTTTGAIGRPRRHGRRFGCADPNTWPTPDVESSTTDSRYGTVKVSAWHGLHPKLGQRGHWADHDQSPIVAGTVIRVDVQHLPKPTSATKKTCGCGPQDPASTSIPVGGPTCDASTSNTPSGSSRTPWAGPHPRCAPPNKPTAGPGSSSPPTPSSASPEASSTTSDCPGNDDANPADLPPPASEGDFVDLPQH